jgi:RNA polymerase sigma-70 factor (ECF subfamily)
MPVTHGLPIERNPIADAERRARIADASAERSLQRVEWMALAQRGDGSAYRALLDDLGPQLARFLRRRLRDREDLADAYQDTFLALHRARHTYHPPRPIEPWLFAIARNIAADYGRRHQRRTRFEVLTDAAPDRPAELTRDLGSELDTALRALPNRQREALQLLKFQGLSIREAAARVGTTPGALKLRAHRAYLAIKSAFGK